MITLKACEKTTDRAVTTKIASDTLVFGGFNLQLTTMFEDFVYAKAKEDFNFGCKLLRDNFGNNKIVAVWGENVAENLFLQTAFFQVSYMIDTEKDEVCIEYNTTRLGDLFYKTEFGKRYIDRKVMWLQIATSSALKVLRSTAKNATTV